jgi:hypothetical protein
MPRRPVDAKKPVAGPLDFLAANKTWEKQSLFGYLRGLALAEPTEVAA